MRLFGYSVLASSAVALALASVAAARPTALSPAAADVVTTLQALDGEECTTICSYNCESGPQGPRHYNQEPFDPEKYPPGNGGEDHSCAWGPEGCGEHACEGGESLSRINLEELPAAIGSLNAEELAAVDRMSDRLRINWDRKAVQVFGCGDAVLVSRRLTSIQRMGLSSQARTGISSSSS